MESFNEELQSLFKIAAGSDDLTPPKKEIISVPGATLCALWDSLEVGSKKSYEDVALRTYFDTLSVDQQYTAMRNVEGEIRKTSVHAKLGNGEYVFISNFATGGGGISYRNCGNLLHDGNIDDWDNLIAAERLLDWLVGRTPYPDETDGMAKKLKLDRG